MFKGINWLAVLLATVVSMALGFVWYDVLFAKVWHELNPGAPASNADPGLIGGVVTILVLSTGMAWVFARTGVRGLGDGLMTAFVVCLAFDTTVYAGNVFLSHASLKGELFYAVFDMISFLVIGAVLSLMPARSGAPAGAAATA